MGELDLFVYGYYAAVCGFLGLGAPILDGALRRILFGVSTGAIAAAALPFVRAWLGY
jgi:hypothetical protein